MKTRTKSLRLSDEECGKLEKQAKAAHMTESEYIRSLLNNYPIQIVDRSAAIMSHVCKIYSLLPKYELAEDHLIAEELNALCRHLS